MLGVDSCEQILRSGANLKIQGLGVDSCVRLASIAKAQGVHLEIKSGLGIDSCIAIARAGGTNVTFDLSE